MTMYAVAATGSQQNVSTEGGELPLLASAEVLFPPTVFAQGLGFGSQVEYFCAPSLPRSPSSGIEHPDSCTHPCHSHFPTLPPALPCFAVTALYHQGGIYTKCLPSSPGHQGKSRLLLKSHTLSIICHNINTGLYACCQLSLVGRKVTTQQ